MLNILAAYGWDCWDGWGAPCIRGWVDTSLVAFVWVEVPSGLDGNQRTWKINKYQHLLFEIII